MGRWLAVLMICAGTWSAAMADELPRSLLIDQPVGDDLYGAGLRVELRAPVDGDAVVAGQGVNIAAPVAQDLIAAGERVTVEAPVGDDLRVVGREVRIENSVAGHLVAAGEDVTLLAGSRIGRFAWIAGRNVTLEGDVGGDLKITGEEVRIAGHVQGNAEVHARRFELLPGGRVDGNLVWSGVERRMDQGSRVGGQVIEKPRPPEREHHLFRVVATLSAALTAGLAVVGLVLYLLFPRGAEALARTIRQGPWVVLGLGLAVLVLTPFVVVLLFATMIGWLLGLLLLLLWLVALPLSGLIGTYALTDWLLGWWRKPTPRLLARAGLFLLAIVLVGLVHLLPVIGWLFGLALMLWGLGATLLLLYRASGPATRREGAPAA